MPQMMPLNWILMFFSLTLTIMMVVTFMFFITNPSPLMNKFYIKLPNLSWKW